MTIEFCYLVFITADYYAITQFIVPRFWKKKKYLLFAAATLFTIAFSAWLRSLIAKQMVLHLFHSPINYNFFSTVYINSLLNITFWVLVITLARMLMENIQSQQLVETLERERIKNELDYLKAQINPHALFNSLNTIYGHIDKNNQVARNILLQFSELLRYQLYDCSEEKISLGKEMEYIKNYISFQRLRKEKNVEVTLHADAVEPQLFIAPLLMVVLIENAFKFVSNFSDKQNSIFISIETKGATLHTSFINTCEKQTLQNGSSGGIGITNLKRRLELLYPNKYKFNASQENGEYKTYLTVDLS